MDEETKSRLTDKNIWVRGVYMLVYAVAYGVAEAVVTLVVIFQFLTALITGSVNDALHKFGMNLSAYLLQILQFQTFNSELRPFPFSDWPDEQPGETPWSEDSDDVEDSAAEIAAEISEIEAQEDSATDYTDKPAVDRESSEEPPEDSPKAT